MPEPLDVAKDSFRDLSENFMPFLMAGLGMLVGQIGAFLAAIPAFIVVGAIGFLLSDTLGELTMLAMAPFYLLGMLIFLIALVGVMGSTYRSVADHVRGAEPLSFNAPFRTATSGLGRGVLFYLVLAIATTIGFILCCFPGIGVAFVATFASPLVFIGNTSLGDALSRAVDFVRNNVGYAATIFAIAIVTVIAAGIIPILSLITTPIANVWMISLLVRATAPAYPELR